jgi:hypothetical protein
MEVYPKEIRELMPLLVAALSRGPQYERGEFVSMPEAWRKYATRISSDFLRTYWAWSMDAQQEAYSSFMEVPILDRAAAHRLLAQFMLENPEDFYRLEANSLFRDAGDPRAMQQNIFDGVLDTGFHSLHERLSRYDFPCPLTVAQQKQLFYDWQPFSPEEEEPDYRKIYMALAGYIRDRYGFVGEELALEVEEGLA